MMLNGFHLECSRPVHEALSRTSVCIALFFMLALFGCGHNYDIDVIVPDHFRGVVAIHEVGDAAPMELDGGRFVVHVSDSLT